MAAAVESWDDDGDLQGDFAAYAGNSVGTAPLSMSSRMSTHSESIGGDDDWNVVLESNAEQSTKQAMNIAKQAGITLPSNIPMSALLGGTIKRLGKNAPRPKIGDLGDDWGNDLDMSDSGALTLKAKPLQSQDDDETDDFDDLEGSLGIRFAGTKRDARNRSSSASAMSPSMGSVTAESEDDDLKGLELPDEPMDFDAILKKRRAAEAELSDLSQASPAIEQPASMNLHKKSKLLADDSDNFLDDFDLGGRGILDNRKRNKNVKVDGVKPAVPAPRTATTLNFHDKPIDKPMHMRSHLPRPVSGSKPQSRLDPVMESGAAQATRDRRQAPATGPGLLRSKRSIPSLRSQLPQSNTSQKPPVPPLPAGVSSYQAQHAAAQRAVPYHLRRDSDPNNRRGAQSPPPRPASRLSNAFLPDTPSRGTRPRPDLAPAAHARAAAAKRTLTKPATRRNFGDGSELEIFDDLPTSSSKESKFVKQPVARGAPKLGLRTVPSRNDVRELAKRSFAIPDRMTTPAPRTPASPMKAFQEPPHNNTPSYLRDTAASRIARESRLANNARPRTEGPLMPISTNWKAQVAARSPHTSPSAQRHHPKKPAPTLKLLKHGDYNVAHTQKGMVFNPQTLRWEGNENTLAHFEIPPPLETPTPTGHGPQTSYMDRQHAAALASSAASPPRPALIAPMSAAAAQGVQVNGGMVFDPRQMKWLKLKNPAARDISGPISPSITDGGDEEEDAFAGIADLKVEDSAAVGIATGGMASPVSLPGGPGGAAATAASEVPEEFDLGPRFIQVQREEEMAWRRRCEAWFPEGEPRVDDGRWRYAIRVMLPPEGFNS